MAQIQPEEIKLLGDQDFMDWLFQTFGPLMWHTAKKYCHKNALWEEIIQESLARLLACIPKLRSLPEEKLADYILVTTRNTTYTLLKKEAAERERVISLDTVELPDYAPTTEEKMIQMEDTEALAKIWDDLPEEIRYLLSSYYFLGYKTAELARKLGCGEGAVRMRLTRARRYVKELIQQKEGGLP